MIYDELSEIKDLIDDLDIFDASRVFIGKEFQIGAAQESLCILKSGTALVTDERVESIAYIMAQMYNAVDIESAVSSALETLMHDLRRIRRKTGYEIYPLGYTTDADVFAPFGVSFTPVPPFGGFRIDVQINKIY
jgi:hypothetical protein